MSKPITVAEAMRGLSEVLSPTPTVPTVKLHTEKLKGGGEAFKFWMSVGLLLQLRTLIVWGFLATFFPTLGVTWFMVMFGLWALRHVVPPKPQNTVDLIAAQRK
jgi:hypothetical protein